MQVKKKIVGQDMQGITVVKALRVFNRKMPANRLYKAIRNGEVRVNKRRVKFSYRLQLNDVVRIPVYDPVEQESVTIPKSLNETIIFENENILVLNKPTALAVHAGSHGEQGVIEIMRQDPRWHNCHLDLVHRLDKDTSGVLLLAKTLKAKRMLAEKFRTREVSKTYVALIEGHLDTKIKKIQHKLSNSYTKMVEDENGKTAITKIISAKYYMLNNRPVTLVKLFPETGRKHQLRVQCQLLGHPIVGDQVYGKKSTQKIFLHAHKLCYIDPIDNVELKFIAPLPKEKQSCIKSLKDTS